jgi:hypothetical protein
MTSVDFWWLAARKSSRSRLTRAQWWRRTSFSMEGEALYVRRIDPAVRCKAGNERCMFCLRTPRHIVIAWPIQ